MSWQELAAKLRPGHVSDLDSALTHVPRLALGLDGGSTSKDGVLYIVRKSDNWQLKNFYDENAGRGMMALIAAFYADWDLAGQVTGGTLGTKIIQKKVFRGNDKSFARHLATACARKLPAEEVAVAMAEQHARYVAGADPRPIAIAAHVFIRELAIVPDVVEATKAWLDGTFVLESAAPAAKAVADGEDPRIKIFERYAPELDPIVPAVRDDHEWERSDHRSRIPLDDLAIRAFVSGKKLWTNWDHQIDPMVAAWLGGTPWSMTKQRFVDVGRGGEIALSRGTYWDAPFFGVACGASIERAKLVAWKPGKFFKDDARKLFAYLVTAIANHATEDDVMPAWHDFLARRSPATTPTVEEGELHWKSLLAIQAVITCRIGKRVPDQAGFALRYAITGR